MTDDLDSPIFYDPARRRWRWFKRILALLLVLGMFMVCSLGVSIFSVPAVASPSLISPLTGTRSGSELFHANGSSSASIQQQLNQMIAALNTQPTPTRSASVPPALVPANPTLVRVLTAQPETHPVAQTATLPASATGPTLAPATTVPILPTATLKGRNKQATPAPTSPIIAPTATLRPHGRPTPVAMSPSSRFVSFAPDDSRILPVVFPLNGMSPFSLPRPRLGIAAAGEPLTIGFYVNWDGNADTSLHQNIQRINRLMPEWLHLSDASGAISDDNIDKENQVLGYIQQNRPDLPVIPLVNSYDPQTGQWNSQRLGQMLDNAAARQQAVKNLLQFVQQNHLAGISIDFEDAAASSQPGLLAFMQTLYGQFHPLGLEVAQVIPFANPAFSVDAYTQYSDYLILAAYDEHWSGGAAGPVASQAWYQTNLARQLSGVDPQKIVVALGGYGYDWTAGSNSGLQVSFQDAVQAARDANATVFFDAAAANPRYTYADAQGKTHSVWYLDAVTAFNQVVLGQRQRVRGFALWRLGTEDPSTWQVLGQTAAPNAQIASALQPLEFGYSIINKGQGEIIKINGVPEPGQREITFDPASGLITGEKMVVLPSAYNILRWGRKDKEIALTFDDGPDPVYTAQVLAVLKKYNVLATFFIVGMNGEHHPELLRQVAAGGHEIGVHTFTHPDISTISPEQFRLELNATQLLIQSQLGQGTLLFRPPYGIDAEPKTPEEVKPLVIASQMGYYTIGMQIDTSDWTRPGAAAIVANTLNLVKSTQGNIILMHDGGGDRSQTVEALPAVIQALQAQGYRFVLVSDLIDLTKAQVMPPVPAQEQLRTSVGLFGFSLFGMTNNLSSLLFFALTVIGIGRMLFINLLAVIQWLQTDDRRYHTRAQPRVSALVPAYNEARVINKTVHSLLRSTYPNLEVVVIDDGSSDDTYGTVLREFPDEPRLRVFKKENGGKATALNYGIQQASGEIIVVLDADTVILPHAITRLARHMSDPRVCAVAGNAKVGNRINLLTRMQALEYITSQNMDRRAFALLNCITVVPGAIGAWRKSQVLQVGGFKADTLAEDADLTLNLLRTGVRIEYESGAIALTEAPENLSSFLKQRFRWMFGMLQTSWKQKDALFRLRYRALGLVALPNILIFSILLPLISPLMDLTFFWSIVNWAVYRLQHPADLHLDYLVPVLEFYIFYLVIDLLSSLLAFVMESNEDWRLVWYLFPQRFFYRQLMYYTAIKTLLAALRGGAVGWNKLERKASVKL